MACDTIPQSFWVVLDCRGNPDYGQDPRRRLPGVPTRRVLVASFAEASAAVRNYIEQHQLGGGNWTGGLITDQQGTLIGYVSFNGRVWRNRSSVECLYTP